MVALFIFGVTETAASPALPPAFSNSVRQFLGVRKARQAGEMVAKVGHRGAVRGTVGAGRGRQGLQGGGSRRIFQEQAPLREKNPVNCLEQGLGAGSPGSPTRVRSSGGVR